MTHLLTTDETEHRPPHGLRRVAALTAVVALGLLVPAAAGASPAGQPGPDDITSDPGCVPDLPCEIDPDECDPLTEICDFTSGGGGPDDPCESEEPPAECEPGEPGTEVEPTDVPIDPVDEPVSATPTFTG
jgi:hypothetical protein